MVRVEAGENETPARLPGGGRLSDDGVGHTEVGDHHFSRRPLQKSVVGRLLHISLQKGDVGHPLAPGPGPRFTQGGLVCKTLICGFDSLERPWNVPKNGPAAPIVFPCVDTPI